MGECCEPGSGYQSTFGDRFARRIARRYQKRGLNKTQLQLVGFLAERGLEGASVLEIGGGLGEIQIELLRHGASRVTNLEISQGYEPRAADLLAASGMADRVDRRFLDIATAPDEVETCDVVVLHRVVCCYPDYRRLLRAAAGRARRAVIFSHPGNALWTRVASRALNALYTVTGNPYRSFAHDPRAMEDVLVHHGFAPRYRERSGPWHVVGTVRG
jgi:2-polyprenyl-3-methyl-5-hydroxy-6-metoxy-1,4-benzoquinol methylase